MVSRRHKYSFIFEFLLVAVGIVIGVYSSQYSYFNISKEISLSDLVIFFFTSLIGLYIANNINKTLSRLQSIKSLYQEDIKDFIKYSNKLDEWITNNNIPLNDLLSHLKKGNVKLRSLEKLYTSINDINTDSLHRIITKYNNLKTDITAISPNRITQVITLTPRQTNTFTNQLEEIKQDLLIAIINS